MIFIWALVTKGEFQSRNIHLLIRFSRHRGIRTVVRAQRVTDCGITRQMMQLSVNLCNLDATSTRYKIQEFEGLLGDPEQLASTCGVESKATQSFTYLGKAVHDSELLE